MKKIISVLLIVLMIFSMAVPAFAADVDAVSSKSQIPVVCVLGDGEPLYDAEGNKIFHLRTSFTESDGK